MNIRLKMTMIVFVIALLSSPFSGTALAAAGPGRLSSQDWYCIPVGSWTYCMPPKESTTSPIVQARIFDTPDVTALDAPFLGTTILIPYDRYHGQPCPQMDLKAYSDVFGGRYCAHFQ